MCAHVADYYRTRAAQAEHRYDWRFARRLRSLALIETLNSGGWIK